MFTNPVQPGRRRWVGSLIAALITVPLAVITLFGIEPPPGLSPELQGSARLVSRFLIEIVSITGAFAVLLGVINLMRVQLAGIRKGGRGLYGVVTVLVFLLIIGLRAAERGGLVTTLDSTAPTISLTVLDALQVAIESALAGMVAFFLIYAAARMLRKRLTVTAIVFIITCVIVLVGYLPLVGLDFLSSIREWLLRIPAQAGLRGLLIGGAIGTVIVGVRVLIGQDRIFRD